MWTEDHGEALLDKPCPVAAAAAAGARAGRGAGVTTPTRLVSDPAPPAPPGVPAGLPGPAGTPGPPGVALLRGTLRRSGRCAVRVSGTSMRPAIQPGDVVTVAAIPYARVRTGDAVLVAWGRQIVVRRVAGRLAADLLLLGDSLPLYDPPTPPEDYLGVVLGVRTAPSRRVQLDAACAALPGPGGWPDGGPENPVLFRTPGVSPAHGHRLRIGISPAGVFPAPTLRRVLASPAVRQRGAEILLGYRFGEAAVAPPGHAEIPLDPGTAPPDPGTAPPDAATLPLDAADLHIRLGRPWQDIPFSKALGMIIKTADKARADAASTRHGTPGQ